MNRDNRSFILAFLVLVFAFSAAFSLQPQDAPSLSVRVTFLDGSTLDVGNAVFVYRWIYQSDAKYFNPPYHRRESVDFHYAEVVHNVQIDRVLPYRTIAKIELSWPKPYKADEGEGYFTPDRLTFTLQDGETIALNDFDATPAFLLDKPVDKVKDNIILRNLELEGLATVEGQRGRFTGRILSRSGAHLKPNEVVKEILIIAPKE